MTANRWSPLAVFLAGGLSGAALIFLCVDGSVTEVLDNASGAQHERDAEPGRHAEAPDLERVATELTKRSHAESSQDGSVGAKSDSVVTPLNEAKAAEKESEEDAPAEVGRSLAQVLAGLEAEYRSQVSAPGPPIAEEPPAAEVEAVNPSQGPSTTTAPVADQPTQHAQKQLGPDEAPARNAFTVATAEETGVTNEQRLVTAQIQQLAALQELAAAQQIAASQQLAVAQQLALLQYLQLVPASLVPVSPASASPRTVPHERRLPGGAFVTRFRNPNTAFNSNPSGFYSTHSVLVR